MIKEMDVPKPYQAVFRRLARRIPEELLVDPKVVETLLLYVKIGGERLARQRIELFKKCFEQECVIFQRRTPETAVGDDDDVAGDAADNADAEADSPAKNDADTDDA
jgi:hypothetical protein